MELACANEQCSYLVHRTEPFGGFCCKRCHQSWSSGRPAQHGFLCEQRSAQRHAARAPPRQPQDPLPALKRRRKAQQVPLQEPTTRSLQHAPSASSKPSASRLSTPTAPVAPASPPPAPADASIKAPPPQPVQREPAAPELPRPGLAPRPSPLWDGSWADNLIRRCTQHLLPFVSKAIQKPKTEETMAAVPAVPAVIDVNDDDDSPVLSRRTPNELVRGGVKRRWLGLAPNTTRPLPSDPSRSVKTEVKQEVKGEVKEEVGLEDEAETAEDKEAEDEQVPLTTGPSSST
ncbi:unc-47 [Symbiodinium sp. CCMP2456]|nr:unc-47 [Symbiodinium sp. CCMP2456]